MSAEISLLKEVESAAAGVSADRRGDMVHKVTDLFVSRSDELTDDDLAIFDQVIMRLSAEIERHARAVLARRLGPIRNAPPQIIRALAFDDDIEVAGPILSQSARLDDRTLIENARTKGQAHMLAISQRGWLSEAITDVLVELGDREVMLNVADNYGADISDRGFSMLVSRSEGDDMLAEFVGSRPEIPAPLLTILVAKASEAVRAKLENAHPRAQEEVARAVAQAADRVEERVQSITLDSSALAAVEGLRRSGKLDERALAHFAKAGAYAETVAALAAMCELPPAFVHQAMARDRSEALMVLAKAVGLSWSTMQDILVLRVQRGIISRGEIVQRLARFERLRSATAQDILKIFRARAQVASSRLS
jgi:uncharacterized protein (DUF2336 family)